MSFSVFENLFMSVPKVEDPQSIILSTKLENNNKSVNIVLTIGYLNNRLKCMKETGSFIIIINSQLPDGPNGIYCISRSNKLLPGSINALIETPGVHDERLVLEWNPCEYPLLKIKTNPINYKTNQNLFFYVKAITT